MGDARGLNSKCPRCGYGVVKVDFLCYPCMKAVHYMEELDFYRLGPRPPAPVGIKLEYGKNNQ